MKGIMEREAKGGEAAELQTKVNEDLELEFFDIGVGKELLDEQIMSLR